MDLLAEGLEPFVAREMKLSRGPMFSAAGGKAGGADPYALLSTIWTEWDAVFKRIFGRPERTISAELNEARNRWAHGEAFTFDATYRALDSVTRLLTAVSAAAQATQTETLKQELLRVKFDEQARTEKKRVAETATEGRPAGDLKPWREIVTPHPDVASGRYQTAEFAADLWQVYMGEGSSEYRDPVEFFRRTFITDGLAGLLSTALE